MTDFAKLVAAMRIAQRTYFKTRAQDTLRQAKALEKRVDDCLKDLE